MATPRLRMFAGPNGSGKTSLKAVLPAELLGVFVGADEIESALRRDGFLDFATYGLSPSSGEVAAFLRAAEWLKGAGRADCCQRWDLHGSRLSFPGTEADSYLASVLAEFIRGKLLEIGVSFTMETVMSHPGKVHLLKEAQARGYRTYLYYVATDDPAINISRVRNRAALGGHNVPEEKIVSRYYRSLGLLKHALKHTNRAYIFDNSGPCAHGGQTWLAEITEGRVLELKTKYLPAWFQQAVLSHYNERD